ncbi:MAG: BTAD domain-containing putative transcriptional regulator [Gemmatimonadaceae bacterium]
MINLRTLGTLELKGGDPQEMRAVVTQPKRLALLAYLALAVPRGYQRRDSLLALFWPEADGAHARNALRQSIHALRQSLGANVVDSRGDEVGLDRSNFSCDAEAFENALEAAQPEEALELYRGDLLPGFFVASVGFEHWLDAERSRLRRLAGRAAWSLSEAAAASGDLSMAVQWARHVAAFSPDDETAVRRLIGLLGRFGDRTGASRVYQSFTRRLLDDFQLEPSIELEALITRITARADAQAAPTSALSTARRSREYGKDERERHRYGRTSGTTETRIAVLPFTLRAANKAPWLREGVAEMLSDAIDGAGSMRSVDVRAVFHFVGDATDPDLQQGKAVSHRFAAQQFVLGTVTVAARKVSLSAALHDADGTLRISARTRTGKEESVFDLVDQLARQLLTAEYGGSAGRRLKSAANSTASLPALKQYLLAEKEFDAGHLVLAREAFNLCLSHDPSFAIAWHRLSCLVAWFHQPEAREYSDRAIKLSTGSSEHDVLIIQAFRALLDGDADKAERLYQKILETYPDDVEAWIGLAKTLMVLNPMRGRAQVEALDALEYARLLAPENLEARIHVAFLSSRSEQYEDLESLRDWLSARSEYSLLVASDWAFARGNVREQEVVLAELERAPDLIVHEASRFAAVVGHDLAGSQRIAGLLTHATRAPEVRATGHVLLAHMQLIKGRVRDANLEFRAARLFAPVQSGEYYVLAALHPFARTSRTELTRLHREVTKGYGEASPNGGPPMPFIVHRDVHPQIRLYLLALLSLRLDNKRAAAAHAVALERLGGSGEGVSLAVDLALSIQAQLAASAGRPAEALAIFSQMRMNPPLEKIVMQSPFFSRNLERYTRARLLEEEGRLDESLQWFDTLCEMGVYEFTYLAPSHYRRGIIHQRLGNRDLAADHFLKVTELWSDCDRAFRPTVSDAARRRAAILRGSS